MSVTTASALHELTASEIARAVNAGRLTCEAVVRACIERIAERESAVQAWEYVDADQAIAAARAFDGSGKGGPLAGVPFGVKDIIDTFDMPTAWGTPIHRGRRPGRDAACVALTRKAGGVLLGKTVTTEFANLHPGKTRNPRDATRTPGGSSSGSAAAVADCMVPIALGTQTTGSTIRPASFCGVFGYRPTYGEHRLDGSWRPPARSIRSASLPARSPISRSIATCCSGSRRRPLPTPQGRRASGFAGRTSGTRSRRATRTRVEDAVRALARAGAPVHDVQLPDEFARLNQAHRWVSSFEFARTFTWEIENHWDEISETLRNGRIADGLSCSFELYVEMNELADRCRRGLDEAWDDDDVLLAPSAYGEAPVGWDAFAGAPLYQMWTVLHLPAISLPVLEGPNGMPIGIQLFAKRHDDRKLFANAGWVYRQLG